MKCNYKYIITSPAVVYALSHVFIAKLVKQFGAINISNGHEIICAVNNMVVNSE